MFTSYSSNLFQRGPAKTNVGSAHGFVGSATLVEAGVVKTTAPLPWARTSVIEVERISLNTMKPASGNEAAEWAVPARGSRATAVVTSGMGRMGTRFGSGARRLKPRFRRVPDSLRRDVSRRRLLVVTTVPVEAAVLRERVLQDANDRDSEVKIVAPAADVSPLQWLASDEDAAREEAHEVAERAAEGVGRAGRVET